MKADVPSEPVTRKVVRQTAKRLMLFQQQNLVSDTAQSSSRSHSTDARANDDGVPLFVFYAGHSALPKKLDECALPTITVYAFE